MLTKEEFLKVINEIKKAHEYSFKLWALNREYNIDANDGCAVILEDPLIELLKKIMHDECNISYFIYELSFGRDYKPGCVVDGNGNEIDLSTADKLYEYLVEQY